MTLTRPTTDTTSQSGVPISTTGPLLLRPIRSHPITAFAILACLFGWIPYLLAAFGVGSHPENTPFGRRPSEEAAAPRCAGLYGPGRRSRRRLMRANGWEGVRRVTKVRTTIADPAADRAPDLVERRFRAPAPNRLLVADFTYVRLAAGCFAYTAFVIDAYANRIVGWECSTSKQTSFVESAIRQAAVLRAGEGHPLDGAIHHSDAGSQYTSVHFGETLLLNGIVPSIGTVGDAFDNALAETTIGLYKHEGVRADSPFRRVPLDRLSDLEMITADWVHWYNTSRLMHHLGRRPPVEAEADYYASNHDGQPAAHT